MGSAEAVFEAFRDRVIEQFGRELDAANRGRRNRRGGAEGDGDTSVGETREQTRMADPKVAEVAARPPMAELISSRHNEDFLTTPFRLVRHANRFSRLGGRTMLSGRARRGFARVAGLTLLSCIARLSSLTRLPWLAWLTCLPGLARLSCRSCRGRLLWA